MADTPRNIFDFVLPTLNQFKTRRENVLPSSQSALAQHLPCALITIRAAVPIAAIKLKRCTLFQTKAIHRMLLHNSFPTIPAKLVIKKRSRLIKPFFSKVDSGGTPPLSLLCRTSLHDAGNGRPE